jgi:predicted transcriptional regulator
MFDNNEDDDEVNENLDDLTYEIANFEEFAIDMRIVAYDQVMMGLSAKSGKPYKPLITEATTRDKPVDVPKEVQEELDTVFPLKVVSEIIKLCIKTDMKDDRWFINKKGYIRTQAALNSEFFGRLLNHMTDEGVMEMCCDKGEIIYRLTEKGKKAK